MTDFITWLHQAKCANCYEMKYNKPATKIDFEHHDLRYKRKLRGKVSRSLESCSFGLSLELAEDGDVLAVSGMDCLRTVEVDSVLFRCLFFLYWHPIVHKDSNSFEVTLSL